MALRTPRVIGPYAVERQIGAGASAIVVEAKHRLLNRRVAIKFRHREQHDEDEDLLAERFRHGAELQAALDHPHVAKVHGYLEAPNWQALVLEYLAGGSISHVLREHRGTLPLEMTLEIGIRAAEGLANAHAKGVIHRDIKPDNLMLKTPNDASSVRVTDFGVAKALDVSPDLTLQGANVGTLWYMSPEQFNRDPLTGAADVYSLGVTLYQMVTGGLPFDSMNPGEIFRRFLDKEAAPAISSRNPAVPVALAAVIEGCIQVEPTRRIPSTSALALLLRAVAEQCSMGLSEAATRRLQALTHQDELDAAVGRLHPEVGRAMSLLEGRLSGSTGLMTFEGLNEEPTPMAAPLIPETIEHSIIDLSSLMDPESTTADRAKPTRAELGLEPSDDFDDEDHTQIMDLPVIDDD